MEDKAPTVLRVTRRDRMGWDQGIQNSITEWKEEGSRMSVMNSDRRSL